MKKKLYIRLLRIRQRMGIFWPLMINGTVLFVIFILGSLGYKYVEGWSLFDGFYMALLKAYVQLSAQTVRGGGQLQ